MTRLLVVTCTSMLFRQTSRSTKISTYSDFWITTVFDCSSRLKVYRDQDGGSFSVEYKSK